MRTKLLLALGTVLASIRLLRMADRHSVDLLFRDQWSFREPFFAGDSLWAAIRFQHGPHRQGLGGLFIAASDWVSGWNIRFECFATAVCIIVAALIALAVKRRLSGSLQAWDVAIPFLFTGYALFELFAVAPNPAHGALPLLLASCAAYALARRWWFAVAVVGVLASHTGFAFYLSLVLIGVCAIEAFKNLQARPVLAALAITASMVYLFTDYVFEPSIACFKFPHDRPSEYLSFLGLYLLRPFATFKLSPWVVALGTLVGCLGLSTSAYVCVSYLRSRDRRWPVVVTLLGFGIAFGVGSGIGRVCGGIDAAFVSRYVPYALTAWLAVYLMAKRWWAVALCIAFIAKDVEPTKNESIARAYSQPKAEWRECYLRLHDWRECDRQTGFPVHFVDEHLDQSFDYLKTHGLNVYRP